MKPEIPKNVVCVAAVKHAKNKQIEAAIKDGIRYLGWSTVQHLRSLHVELAKHKHLHHHFIGHLQRNKVRQLLTHPIELIHSGDSKDLVVKINAVAQELSKKQPILLQIKSDQEKEYGLDLDEAREILTMQKNLSNISIEGLMTIPSPKSNPRTVYKGLRMQRDKLEKEFDVTLSVLSMGMSDDYKIAIEEGATIVRLGKILFGK